MAKQNNQQQSGGQQSTTVIKEGRETPIPSPPQNEREKK